MTDALCLLKSHANQLLGSANLQIPVSMQQHEEMNHTTIRES